MVFPSFFVEGAQCHGLLGPSYPSGFSAGLNATWVGLAGFVKSGLLSRAKSILGGKEDSAVDQVRDTFFSARARFGGSLAILHRNHSQTCTIYASHLVILPQPARQAAQAEEEEVVVVVVVVLTAIQ